MPCCKYGDSWRHWFQPVIVQFHCWVSGAKYLVPNHIISTNDDHDMVTTCRPPNSTDPQQSLPQAVGPLNNDGCTCSEVQMMFNVHIINNCALDYINCVSLMRSRSTCLISDTNTSTNTIIFNVRRVACLVGFTWLKLKYKTDNASPVIHDSSPVEVMPCK